MSKHPFFKGIVFIVAFVIVAEFLVILIPPAWAATTIQITDRIVIDLGDLPQWVIGIVAALSLWKSWSADNKAKLAVSKIEEVRIQTDGMLTSLKDAEKAKGNLEGREELKGEIIDSAVVKKETARRDVIDDAETAAKVLAIEVGKV